MFCISYFLGCSLPIFFCKNTRVCNPKEMFFCLKFFVGEVLAVEDTTISFLRPNRKGKNCTNCFIHANDFIPSPLSNQVGQSSTTWCHTLNTIATFLGCFLLRKLFGRGNANVPSNRVNISWISNIGRRDKVRIFSYLQSSKWIIFYM